MIKSVTPRSLVRAITACMAPEAVEKLASLFEVLNPRYFYNELGLIFSFLYHCVHSLLFIYLNEVDQLVNTHDTW